MIILVMSFILGFSAYLISEAAQTFLGISAILALIGFILLYLHNQEVFFREWEKFVVQQENSEEIKEAIKENYSKNEFPKTYTRTKKDYFRELYAPKNAWSLGLQLMFWGVVMVFFLLWNNYSTGLLKNLFLSIPYELLKPILLLTRANDTGDLSAIGPRHILFGLAYLLSHLVILIDRIFYYNEKWSKSLFMGVFSGGYALLWINVIYWVVQNTSNLSQSIYFYLMLGIGLVLEFLTLISFGVFFLEEIVQITQFIKNAPSRLEKLGRKERTKEQVETCEDSSQQRP